MTGMAREKKRKVRRGRMRPSPEWPAQIWLHCRGREVLIEFNSKREEVKVESKQMGDVDTGLNSVRMR